MCVNQSKRNQPQQGELLLQILTVIFELLVAEILRVQIKMPQKASGDRA